MAALADGRIVYQRNQVHFAPFHPLSLALLDTRRRSEVSLYPPRPVRELRRGHVDRLRAVCTSDRCNTHSRSCDPERFDEHLSSGVLAHAGGDALAFLAAWANTVGCEARLGAGLPERALDPAVRRTIFCPDVN
jgi:hypothetical protein